MPIDPNLNQNTNQSPPWMDLDLQVIQVGDGSDNLGVVIPDTLVLTSQNTIVLQPNLPQGVQGPAPPPTVWGTWTSTSDPETLKGFTTAGDPVTIVHDAGHHTVTCTWDKPVSPPGPFGAIGLGAFLGTVIGTTAGFVAGVPLFGALVGLGAGSAGSGAALALRVLTSNVSQGGGAVVTWVANDGGAGVPKPGPHGLPRVG